MAYSTLPFEVISLSVIQYSVILYQLSLQSVLAQLPQLYAYSHYHTFQSARTATF
jgi:hypothetical protein